MDNNEGKLYVAYGSNINLRQMEKRCPTAVPVSAGFLSDFELEFRGVANIVPKKDAKVPVLLWRIRDYDERSLDIYEGFPRLYRKENVKLNLENSTCEAMVYVMNSGEIAPPSDYYLDVIRQGYLAVGLDMSYLEDAVDRAYEIQELNQSLEDLE